MTISALAPFEIVRVIFPSMAAATSSALSSFFRSLRLAILHACSVAAWADPGASASTTTTGMDSRPSLRLSSLAALRSCRGLSVLAIVKSRP